MQTLTEDTLRNILKDVMFDKEFMEGKTEKDLMEISTQGNGIQADFRFHTERMMTHKDEIKELLSQLDGDYFTEEGFPPTKLNIIKDGNKRTDNMRLIDGLIGLGYALGWVTYPQEAEADPIGEALARMMGMRKMPPMQVIISKDVLN